jgi:ABC-type multidrug transport system fused ATPase/permease subunit
MVIPQGSRVAIVGSSGAGKSTLLDLILGLLEPTSGQVTVGGVELEKVIRGWRSGIGFVPQEVTLFNASIARNVALRWDDSDINHERVDDVIRQAQLVEMVRNRPAGLDSVIGERGMSLSGGQKQRLGIARALYTQPTLLVLDEATSALDTATEHAVTTVIDELPPDVTVITVAHRLATIRSADIVFYFAEGELKAFGSFEEVVSLVPDFANQSRLAGLTGSKPLASSERSDLGPQQP